MSQPPNRPSTPKDIQPDDPPTDQNRSSVGFHPLLLTHGFSSANPNQAQFFQPPLVNASLNFGHQNYSIDSLMRLISSGYDNNAPQSVPVWLIQYVMESTAAIRHLENKIDNLTQLLSSKRVKTDHTQLNRSDSQINSDERSLLRCPPQAPNPPKPNHSESHPLDSGSDQNSINSNTEEDPSSTYLLRQLFGRRNYQYRLQLANNQSLSILFRQRNFSLQLTLVDNYGHTVPNHSNKIPLTLSLYTSEQPPKLLEKNTMGIEILKGVSEQSLHNGVCRFDKVQIRQVSSHYRNGWVFMIIVPSMGLDYSPKGPRESSSKKVYGGRNQSTGSEMNGQYIPYDQIEPLVIDHVVVRAKKLKIRDSQTKRQDQSDYNSKSVKAYHDDSF